MWNFIFILLFGNIVESHDISAVGNPYVQMQAERRCRKLGPGWHLPRGTDNNKNLTSLMISRNFSSLWLGVQRRKLPTFQWVNRKPSHTLDPLKTDKGCVTLSLEHVISPHVCADETSGFICEFSECPAKLSKTEECFVNEQLTFAIICDAQNWYKARIKCRNYGGHLAILDNNHKTKTVMRQLEEKAHKWSCLSFYIGLHCEDWTVFRDGEYEAVDTDKWDDLQPSNGHDDCVKLVLNNRGQARWHTANCHTRNPVVCQRYNSSSNDKNSSADGKIKLTCPNNTAEDTKCEKLTECSSEREKTILLGVFVPLACIAALVVVIVICTKRLRKQRKRQQEADIFELTTREPPRTNSPVEENNGEEIYLYQSRETERLTASGSDRNIVVQS